MVVYIILGVDSEPSKLQYIENEMLHIAMLSLWKTQSIATNRVLLNPFWLQITLAKVSECLIYNVFLPR